WETQSMMYNWQGSVWVNSSKYDYTYDGSGNEILDVFSLAAGPSWIAMEADTSKWSGGKNTEIVHNHMIPPSVTRTQFTYDGNGNMTVDLGQNWSGSAWVNSDRAVYVYQAALAVSCGDVDASGSVDIADVVYLIAYIFSGGAAPNPLAAGDVDCSGEINIADIVYLINYIFRGGAAPCNACP
ncbi:MAG: dockerin type I repeat-containing protein, partial [candidate division Zixibacteria bacterium]|nr:dockerin type I repeat-containing protein [candidate division Zixibacteria bacterium]